MYGKKYFRPSEKQEMNYFLVFLDSLFEKRVDRETGKIKKCMKNYTKIFNFVENFTVPLAFLGKGGILIMYPDVDFSEFVVILDMH